MKNPDYNTPTAIVKSDISWGFLGNKNTSARTEFQAEKDEYYFGDTVNVRVIYDGSKCEKDAT